MIRIAQNCAICVACSTQALHVPQNYHIFGYVMTAIIVCFHCHIINYKLAC